MHLAFTNCDVVFAIFKALGEPVSAENPRVLRRSLVNLGLSCKLLLEPALDQLWYSIDSLLPLLMILPIVENDNNGNITFDQFTKVHWDRLNYYGERVRSFVTSGRPTSASTCAQVWSLKQGHLFPKLRNLTLCIQSFTTVSEMTLLLNAPSIEMFKVTAGGLSVLLDQTFTMLAQLHGHAVQEMILSATPRRHTLLEGFKSLRALNVGASVGPVLLRCIGEMTSLQRLKLLLASGADFSNAFAGSTGMLFKNVVDLEISGPAGGIKALVESAASIDLSQLKIQSQDQDTDELWNRMFFVIQAKWKGKLKDLSLLVNSNAVSLPQSMLNPNPTFSLDSLFLSGWKKVTFDELRHLAPNFKSLRKLHLSSLIEGEIFWECLSIINEELPSLKYLSLWVNYSTKFWAPDVDAPNLAHPLRTLEIGFHPNRTPDISTLDQVSLARCLDRLFPHVELSALSNDSELIKSIWDLLLMFKSVRLQNYKDCKCKKCLLLATQLELKIKWWSHSEKS